MKNSLQPLHEQKKKSSRIEFGFIKIPRSALPIIEKVFLLLIVALAIYYFFPKISSFQETLHIFRALKPWAVLLAIAAQLLRNWYAGYALKECVNITNKKISTFQAILITLTSYSVGLVAGGMVGGSATTYRWVIVSGGDKEGASLGSVIPSIFLSFAFTAVSLIGVVFLFTINNLSGFEIFFFALIALFLALIAISLVLAVKYQDKSVSVIIKVLSAIYRLFKKELSIAKLTRELQQLFKAWNRMTQSGWKKPFWGSFLNVGFDILTVLFLFWATGTYPTILAVITGYGLPNLFGRMAFMIPGGVGLIESTMVAIYNSLGIENSISTVVMLTYRFLSFWLPSVLGFFFLPYFNKLTKDHYKELEED